MASLTQPMSISRMVMIKSILYVVFRKRQCTNKKRRELLWNVMSNVQSYWKLMSALESHISKNRNVKCSTKIYLQGLVYISETSEHQYHLSTIKIVKYGKKMLRIACMQVY